MQQPSNEQQIPCPGKRMKVFISSPNDVPGERKAVHRVLDRLNAHPLIRRRYCFEPLDFAQKVPPLGVNPPYRTIDEYMGLAGESDTFICIFGHRFGAPLVDADHQPIRDPDSPTHELYQSGTEYEFLNAYRVSKDRGKPDILLYRRSDPPPRNADPDQLKRLRKFFERFEGDGDLTGLFKPYETPAEFEEMLFQDLLAMYGALHEDPSNARHQPPTTGFVGRERELGELKEWMADKKCRLVSIVAGGGTGKSVLAVKAVEALQAQGEFQYVFWRSLGDSKPLVDPQTQDGILDECLDFLPGVVSDRPLSTDAERFERLKESLSQRRCLIVLDNAETIMRPDEPDLFREGYENYGQLIESVARGDHNSCLLITSRQQPRAIELLRRAGFPVETMPLQGLDRSDAWQFLMTAVGSTRGAWARLLGLFGVESAASERVANLWEPVRRYYHGNPNALKVVAGDLVARLKQFAEEDEFAVRSSAEAAKVAEARAKDIAEYLYRPATATEEVTVAQDTHVRDIIYLLLEEVVDPLPPLERAMLYWLAIRRRGVSRSYLLSALIPARTEQEVDGALNRLSARFLIQAAGDGGYTLQPFIMDFVKDRLVNAICAELDTRDAGALDLFSHHALATAVDTQEYVRETQQRVILRQVLKHLRASAADAEVAARLRDLLTGLRSSQRGVRSYAAGNVLNLLAQLQSDVQRHDLLNGLDLSGLYVWEAYLQGMDLQRVDFSAANLERSVFTEPFGTVLSVALSPDGTMLAAGTGNGDIRLWDAETGQPRDIIKAHTSEVWTLAFHYDGDRLRIASGSEDRNVKIHRIDAHDDEIRHELIATLAHDHPIRSVAFRPDGQLLATGGEGRRDTRSSHDNTIRLYGRSLEAEDEAWERVATISGRHGHSHWIRSVAFSPDGKLLASGGEDERVRVWDVSNARKWRHVETLERHHGKIRSVAFSPDNTALASASEDRTIRLWDTSGWRAKRRRAGHAAKYVTLRSGHSHTLRSHTQRIRSIAFSPDSTRLLSGDDSGEVRLWDIAPGQPTRGQLLENKRRHTSWIWSVAYSPDPNRPWVASGSEDQTIRVWDADTLENRYVKQGHISWIRSVAFAPDGRTLASGEDRLVRYWDLEHRDPLDTVPAHTMPTEHDRRVGQGHTGWVRTVAFSPDGTILASCGEDHTIQLWDREGRHHRTLRGKRNPVRALAFHPRGTLLAGAEDEVIRLWRYPILRERDPKDILTTYDGVLGRDEEDGKAPAKRREGPAAGHRGPIWAIAFSPDGELLASGGEDRDVRVWDVQSRKCIRVLPGHDSWIRSVAFWQRPTLGRDRPGRSLWRQLFGDADLLLASSSEDSTVRIWDVYSGRRFPPLKGAVGGHFRSVAFHPSGHLICAAEEGIIRMWQVPTWRILPPLQDDAQTLQGETNWVWSLAFSPDGRMLASGSSDLTIRLWRFPEELSQEMGGEHQWVSLQARKKSIRPYEGMNILGARLSRPQAASLALLGAVGDVDVIER